MEKARLTVLLAWAALPALALTACTERDDGAGPIPIASADARKVKTLEPVTLPTTIEGGATVTYTWEPVKRNEWAEAGYGEAVFNQNGGRLKVGDVLLRVPKGALDGPVRISMQVLEGDEMYVLFWPHGLQFKRPAKLGFSIEATEAAGASTEELAGVYFESLYEETPTMLKRFGVSRNGNWMLFDIKHFSYYSLFIRRGYTAAGAD